MWRCVVCFLGVLGRHVSIAQSLLLNPSISLALRQLEAKKRRGTVRRGCFDGKWSSILVSPKKLVHPIHQGPNSITKKFTRELSRFSSINTPSSSLTPI
jgi:hypothetical protein